MASISFYARSNLVIQNLNGSGIGFFGSGFGNSVDVSSYQDTTWMTDGNGVTQGPQIDNNKWTHANSGSINGAASILLRDIPNYLATLNVRFTHSSPVKTQNAYLRIFDRSNINNPASGVTTKVYEIRHPSTTQTGELGSGNTIWSTPTGSSVVLSCWASPGISGQRPNGAGTTATDHDWYFAISASPDSIGSKTLYALYFETEYL